mmetsp:Transcript_140548/g.262184  ORF Transcript_140548/g.262184 Transcript_140548/m.262184 type:complete len:690 (-) Transcript_140548:80-2149(-)
MHLLFTSASASGNIALRRLFLVLATTLGFGAGAAGRDLRIVQTAFDLHNPHLLKELPIQKMDPGPPSVSRGALVVNSSIKFQEMLGFGGAFTEAAAFNWRTLSVEDQKKVIQLYFADPSEGGHGYTLGRVPMGSCDFSLGSYSFDNVSGDVNLTHFDTDVTHDEVNGMLPMMRAAQRAARGRGHDLKIFASPWSPPPWMKLPVNGEHWSNGSATPVGLDARYQRAWAKYFSKFIDAYRRKGVNLWGVTPQNEPEYAAHWDACVYTPKFEAEFVREHLGPVLHYEQPGVKIIGFDHNKDHVVEWAEVLYGDNDTKKFFDGIGVHWYGGLNQEHLQKTHELAPDKFILATEACNCPGVVHREKTKTWWSRAEKLAIDILEDIKWWAVGWVDWNLLLDTKGGPNWAGNNCDANLIADPKRAKGGDAVIMQASYYYMGHFSRFIPPGSRRIDLKSTVKTHNDPDPKELVGLAMQFTPCSNKPAQLWRYDTALHTLSLASVPSVCAQLSDDYFWKIVMQPCGKEAPAEPTQMWSVTSDGSGGYMFENNKSHDCLTSTEVPGQAIGLDPGVDAEGGIGLACNRSLRLGENPRNWKHNSFSLVGNFPDSFQIQTPEGNCMLPVGLDNTYFDAVAFETPSGEVSLVAMNLRNSPAVFDIHDVGANGSYRAIELPAHSIATYMWKSGQAVKSADEIVV